MRGRKPKPTHLKVLEGNAGKRALEPDAATPVVAVPECPDHLTDEARIEWERIAGELETLGLIGHVDRAMLAAYCQAYGRWVAAERELETHGYLIKTPNGYPAPNPYLPIANKAMEQMRAFGSEFGMSPAARSRVKGNAQLTLPGMEDEFGTYLEYGKRA